MLMGENERAAWRILRQSGQEEHGGVDLEDFTLAGGALGEMLLDRTHIVRVEIPIDEGAHRVDV
jgi:hypothetical protein